MNSKILLIIICFFASQKAFSQINSTSHSSVTSDTCLIFQHGSRKAKNVAVSDNSPDQNYAGFYDIRAVAWTLDGSPFIDRTYFYFDISDLPLDLIVQHAYLSLYNNPNSTANGGQHSSLSGPNSCVIKRVIAPWQENTITWNNQPAVDTVHEVFLPQSTSPHEDYLNIDVTNIVQDMVSNPNLYFGFMLRLNTEIHYRCLVFASSNNPDSTLHPKLEICYSTPTPVNDPSSDEGFYIYPNPTSGIFSIVNFERSNNYNYLQVINYFGETVLEKFLSPSESYSTINLAGKAKGIYFVVLSNENKRFVTKVIVQ